MKIIWSSSFLVLLFRTAIYLSLNGVLNLEWSAQDARFDCVVGILADGKPIGTGVFIASDTVLTSANVVEDYVHSQGRLTVHIVGPRYHDSSPRRVGCIASVFGHYRNRKKTDKYWLHHGIQWARENSPLHDLYTLGLINTWADMTDRYHFTIAVVNKDHYPRHYHSHYYYHHYGDYGREIWKRYPFMVRMVWGSPYIEHDYYMWGGFGYRTQNHVRFSNWMEMEIYGEKLVIVDCDEWVPREWGHFICIENVNNNPGVASGAPLFHKGRLVGIGSFMLEKNNESILAFTDLRKYSKNMNVCVNMGYGRFALMRYADLFYREAYYSKRLAF